MNLLFLLTPKSSIAYVYEDNTLRQALERMREHHFTAVPVLSRDGKYTGTVSEGDFLWHMLEHEVNGIKGEESYYVRDIIRAGWNPAVCIDETMDELRKKAMQQNFIPVIDGRDLFVGIITRKDIIEYYYAHDKKE